MHKLFPSCRFKGNVYGDKYFHIVFLYVMHHQFFEQSE